MERFSVEAGKTVSLGKEGIETLESNEWPGNVRQLENLMERAVALTPDGHVISPELLGSDDTRRERGSRWNLSEGFHLPSHLNEIECAIVSDALQRSGGNQRKAAELLGIPVHSIRHLIGKHGL